MKTTELKPVSFITSFVTARFILNEFTKADIDFLEKYSDFNYVQQSENYPIVYGNFYYQYYVLSSFPASYTELMLSEKDVSTGIIKAIIDCNDSEYTNIEFMVKRYT